MATGNPLSMQVLEALARGDKLGAIKLMREAGAPNLKAALQAIEAQALAARESKPADRLFDQGRLAFDDGRLLDAYRLLHGALLRDPQHDASRRLLLRVMGERELRLNSLKGLAAQDEEQRKFDEATRQWEAVQALTLDDEPLHAHARTELARLRQRAAQ